MKTMSKNIWIINQYGSLPSTGIGGRHRHIARELSVLGYNTTLISARWTHVTRDEYQANIAPEIEAFEGFKFLRVDVNKYKHAHDKKRILNWFKFAWEIRKASRKLTDTPDVILYSSPSLIPYLTAYRLAKKFNAKLVFEVRDIWPLTLKQLGGFSSKHPFIRFMQWIEEFAYKKSDAVISNLEGSVEHMKEHGLKGDSFSWIPNGYSEEELSHPEDRQSHIIDAINKQTFSVTYTGAIGEANALDTLVHAADLLKERKDIHFNIVGRGRLSEKLELEASKLGLDNVHFWEVIPKDQVQQVLRASKVCIICWKNSELYRYGVAANKLFDYMYSGRPIINSYSGGYDIVKRYRAGVTVPAEDPSMLSEAIKKLSKADEQVLDEYGASGRKMVQLHHEYGLIAEKLSHIFESLSSSSNQEQRDT